MNDTTDLRGEKAPVRFGMPLAPREVEIAKLIGQDPEIPNRDAAARLGMSYANLKTTLHRIYVKGGIKSRRELSKYAMVVTCLLLAIPLRAQPTLTLSGPATAAPGASVPVVLTLSGSAGANVTAIQFTVADPTPVSFSAITSAAPGKNLFCQQANPTTCVELGYLPPLSVNNTVMVDGPVATATLVLTASATGAISLPLSALSAITSNGTSIPLSAGTAYILTAITKCDVNGNGKTDGADVGAVIDGYTGKAACPVGATCTFQSIVAVLLAAVGGACTL